VNETLIRVGAILILIFGAVYPLAAMVGMALRMNKPGIPTMGPMTVMVRLMLIATVPLAGILGGFAGLVPTVWESFVLRVLILSAAAASVLGFVALAVLNRLEKTQQQASTAKTETTTETVTDAKTPVDRP
jgi:hypothetical protein